ncbi:MAG: DNA polymerase IV [Cycloclasticus sp. symbiont of Poecilosclerida sp. M]|nr:MAG: DNA polymerase IV [Cycloclasticus sp. symbiont of Poecilosclerida sp. M]
MPTQQRKIIHVDMDAFFASVEQRDNPELRNKPVIVGGQPDSRGVVAACSYEARQFGIHSAMPCSRAYRLCPQAVFVKPRFDAYKAVSKKIQEIFWRYASDVEPLSLDEAYLDVSQNTQFESSATRMAQAIKHDIKTETKLIASAGVSYNKFLAKVASDMDKPDGLYVITPEQGADFVAALDIGKFYGVGPVTEKKMHALGIKVGADLRQKSQLELATHFGKAADYFYHIARGVDHRPVSSSRIRKSLGKETTFTTDITNTAKLTAQLNALAEAVFANLQTNDLIAKTITLKIKYSDFQTVTRAYTSPTNITKLSQIYALIPELLLRTNAGQQGVRLVGISASNFAQKKALKKGLQFDVPFGS